MKLQLIRNATMRIEYGGQIFLTDPMLSEKYGIESFAGNSRNPTVDLPCSIDEILLGVDAILSSHIHQDHFDQTAKDVIPSETIIYCQPSDIKKLSDNGFISVKPVAEKEIFNGIGIIRTSGHHGSGEIEKEMGTVCGYILKADNEPVVYWAGDTIFCDEVEQVIAENKPDYIITHSCGAGFEGTGPIIMDAEQTLSVCKAAPDSTIIAVHMESLDHATVTRQELRVHANKNGISDEKLLIPDDGEIILF